MDKNGNKGSGHAAGAGSPSMSNSMSVPLPVPLLTTEKEPIVDELGLCDFFEFVEVFEVALSIKKDLSEDPSLLFEGRFFSVGIHADALELD